MKKVSGKQIVGIFIICILAVCLLGFFLERGKAALQKEQILSAQTFPVFAASFAMGEEENTPLQDGASRPIDEGRRLFFYHVQTEESWDLVLDDLFIDDVDLKAGELVGHDEEQVVLVDLKTGARTYLGPARCGGESFNYYPMVKKRPLSQDFCAITETGALVFWDSAAQEFTPIPVEGTDGNFYGCCWVEDGKFLCIPDRTGIALYDPETGEKQHWLDLSICYPEGDFSTEIPPDFIPCPQVFEVANDLSMVVYYAGSELRLVRLDRQGAVENEDVLAELEWDCCGFSISPDGDSVIYSAVYTKNALFNPPYISVGLYHDGRVTVILPEEDYITPPLFMFW